jgi:hypothetical protein
MSSRNQEICLGIFCLVNVFMILTLVAELRGVDTTLIHQMYCLIIGGIGLQLLMG